MATKWAEGRPRFGSAREEACRGANRPAGREQRDVYQEYTHRRFFDGVICKPDASFSTADCVRFMSALLEFDDHPDILYRLTNPREYGLQYLRVALNQADSPEFLAQALVPFLAKLGHDSLNIGMWRKPLLEVLDAISTVPGLLPRLGAAITSGSLPDAAPVAWFALTLAVNSETARANPELEALVHPLLACGGGAAVAARLLKPVLSPAGLGLGSSGQVLALEDLRMQAGGRHDNDAPNFRNIKIVFTSDEEEDAARKRSASDQEAVRLRGKAAALQQQLRALEDDLWRRKELMAVEMEVKKLELALELQKAQAPAQLAAWAAEQEHQAVVDQAAQEERAAAERLRLEANKLAAEEATKQAKLMKGRANQERQLAASSAQLLQAEADKQLELQRIENDKRRVVAESASRREVVEGKAQAQLLSATTALKWREAVAAAGRDGAAGLEALRQLLQQAAQEQQERSQQASDTLDTVLGYSSGLGARLLQYATAPPAAEDQHLSKAVSAAAQAKSGQGGRQQPGQSAAVVVGEALACLLHPGTPAWLPAPLQQLAQGLLSEHAATFAATGPMLAAVASAFDRLGPEFLADLQGALEQQGHDLSNEALVQQLAGDGSLPDALLPLLARSAGSARDLGMLREMVRQWQRSVLQQMELQRKLAKKGKRPFPSAPKPQA
ncbi:hypothetical protein V8C86DRAFT_3133805 [Haematococcus lacustris]